MRSAGVLLSMMLVASAAAQSARTLADVENELARAHPGVSQIATDDFEALRQSGATVTLIDAREVGEFRTGHIAGATRVDPKVDTERFMQEFADRAAGTHVVVYCAVGSRSSRLIDRLQTALKSRGVLGVYNLTGGMMRWQTERRSIARPSG